jgi:hypothetical protein
MRARFYHPRLMRFLNQDPIGFEGGMNWFAFVNGNPILGVDPSGLCRTAAGQLFTSGATESLIYDAFAEEMLFRFANGVLGAGSGAMTGATSGAVVGAGIGLLAGGVGAGPGAVAGAGAGAIAGGIGGFFLGATAPLNTPATTIAYNAGIGGYIDGALAAPFSVVASGRTVLTTAAAENAGAATVKGAPKPTPNFKIPTNPAQPPPATVPPSYTVRVMPPTKQYPNGYWRLEKPMPQGGAQGINPSTMKPGAQQDTHIPLPPGWTPGG